jgi:hypothetical protein
MYTMKASVTIAKEADAKKGFSPARSDNSIQRLRDEHEMQLGSLRGVIGNITRDGGTPSVEGIATELSGMHTAQHAPALLALQRTHGNRYVQRVVAGIQAKLRIGQSNDIYEQEADRVAEQVMRMPEPGVQRQVEEEEEEEDLIQTKPLAEQITPLVQRQVEEEKKEEEILQTKESSKQSPAVSSNLETNIQSSRTGGTPLPESIRAFFEPRFGHDFSKVKLHTNTRAAELAHTEITPLIQRQESLAEEEDEELIQTKIAGDVTPEVTPAISTGIQSLQGGGQPLSASERGFFQPRFGADFYAVRIHADQGAAEMARAVNARAFTFGHNIVFGAGQFRWGSVDTRRLLAHELTHVLQQSSRREGTRKGPNETYFSVGIRSGVATADAMAVQKATPLEITPVARGVQRTCESEELMRARRDGRAFADILIRADDAVRDLNSDPNSGITDITWDLRPFISRDETGQFRLNPTISLPSRLSEEERACFEEGFGVQLSGYQETMRWVPSPDIAQYSAAALATASAGRSVGGLSIPAGARPRVPRMRGTRPRGSPGWARSPLALLLPSKTAPVRPGAAAPAMSSFAPPTPLTAPTTSVAGVAIAGATEPRARERVIPEMLPERGPLPSEETQEIEPHSEELWDPEQRERRGCAPPVHEAQSGGSAEHDALAAHISGWPMEFRLTTPDGVSRSFDAMSDTGVLYEVKTGHDMAQLLSDPDWPGPLPAGRAPHLRNVADVGSGWGGQIEEQSYIAGRCGYEYRVATNNQLLVGILREALREFLPERDIELWNFPWPPTSNP